MARNTADSEARIFRDGGGGLRFFVTAVLSIALMIVDHRGDYLRDIRARLAAGLYPLQVAINAPFSAGRWMRENLAFRETLVSENAELRRQQLVAAGELQRLAALKAENERLRSLLDATGRVPARVELAGILDVDMDPLRHRVVLDRGSRGGAYEGQALIDASGVVGQVTRDQLYTSEAILITDPDHAVPVQIERNGLRTIAVGTGDAGRLSLPFLTRNADVKEGDLLVSSGLGGTFPAGYPVGTVTVVDRSGGDAFLEISAAPAAQLDRLHEVLLVFSPAPAVAAPGPNPPAPAARPVAVPAPAPKPAPAPAPAQPPAAAPAPAPSPAPNPAPNQAPPPAPTPDTSTRGTEE